VLTYSLPTTTKDTYDYHLIKGEAEETMMPTYRMPTVAPVRVNCTGVTHSHHWDRLSQQADLASTAMTVRLIKSAHNATSIRVVLGRKENLATVKTMRLDKRADFDTSLKAEHGKNESDTCFK